MKELYAKFFKNSKRSSERFTSEILWDFQEEFQPNSRGSSKIMTRGSFEYISEGILKKVERNLERIRRCCESRTWSFFFQKTPKEVGNCWWKKKKQSAFIADAMLGGTSGSFWEVIWVISRKKNPRKSPELVLDWFWKKKSYMGPSPFPLRSRPSNTLYIACRLSHFHEPPSLSKRDVLNGWRLL